MDKIRKLMGGCPQHDLLCADLTGRQHLEFFCRFKNVPGDRIDAEVKDRLEEVKIQHPFCGFFFRFHNVKPDFLSGGGGTS